MTHAAIRRVIATMKVAVGNPFCIFYMHKPDRSDHIHQRDINHPANSGPLLMNLQSFQLMNKTTGTTGGVTKHLQWPHNCLVILTFVALKAGTENYNLHCKSLLHHMIGPVQPMRYQRFCSHFQRYSRCLIHALHHWQGSASSQFQYIHLWLRLKQDEAKGIMLGCFFPCLE